MFLKFQLLWSIITSPHDTEHTILAILETRQSQGQLLLGWDTACEYQVLRAPKAWLELALGCNIKGIQKSFCFDISSKRLNKRNTSLLLNGVGDLAAVETDTAKELNAVCASGSTSKISLTSLLRCKVPGYHKLPGRNQD